MRTNIYDLIATEECNPHKEALRLRKQFFEDRFSVYMRGSKISLCEYIEQNVFETLPCRRSSTSIFDLMSDVKIDDDISSLDDLFSLCEFLAMLLDQGCKYIQKSPRALLQAEVVNSSMEHILNLTNHEFVNDNEGGRVIIEKNVAASQATSLIEDSKTALKVLEYNNPALSGEIVLKKEIILTIYLYIESLLVSLKRAGAPYAALSNDIGFMLNSLNIRHDNTSGGNIKEFAVKMTPEEQEKWLDNVYNSMLMAIIAKEQIRISSEIKVLKSQ
ncbi:MAG: hypothetical protein LBN34_03240 [Clostridiales Family XIII bacterium]|jgi:hypothetical protein|nr:hypothetical protein [Clostridiales Family XIII bacterium]